MRCGATVHTVGACAAKRECRRPRALPNSSLRANRDNVRRLKSLKALGIAVAAAVLALSSLWPAGAFVKVKTTCGHELWPLKTLSDPQRRLVDLHPRATTVKAIGDRVPPRLTPSTRTTAFERHTWRVRAQIIAFRIQPDSDIHLVLVSHGAPLIAEMTRADCVLHRTRDRKAITKARTDLVLKCRRPLFTWTRIRVVASLSGVGFWDYRRGQRGHAPNYAELHPVTAFRAISGCRRG